MLQSMKNRSLPGPLGNTILYLPRLTGPFAA
jgi:hypothetical protein